MRTGLIAALLFLGAGSSLVHADEKIGSTDCQVYFSPRDKIAERLIDLINNEKKSIRAAVYCLTHRGVATALLQAKQRGVDVEVVVDPFSLKARAPVHRIAEAGVPVFVWDPVAKDSQKSEKAKKPLMHDKFCVFSDGLVWTGSFNFTYEATNSHQENVVLLKDITVAKRYIEHFKTMKAEGCRPYSDYRADHPSGKRK